MVTNHPIHVKRDSYKGNVAKRTAKANLANRTAAVLEKYINEKIAAQTEPIAQYMYSQISHATGVPVEVVRELCFVIDGGHNGFTVVKPGMTYAQAMEARRGQ